VLIRLRQLLRRSRGQEGSAAVEFAIVLPILILLLAGFFDFGWLFYWQHTVTNASRAGARYGVQANYPVTGNPPVATRSPHTDAEIKIIIDKYGDGLTFTVDPASRTNYAAGGQLSVTVTKTMQWLFLGFLQSRGVPLPSTVQNKTTMTME
jgi:Flp pilus assembly protein TadG